MDRRGFLRVVGSAAAMATVGTACRSDPGRSDAQGASSGTADGERVLRIAQWSAEAAGLGTYDDWFDNHYTQRWGGEHGVGVVVDHFRLSELSARAEADVAAQGGHDIFGFSSPPAAFEDHVLDHREIHQEIEAKLGSATPLAERSVRNPVTGKYFGVPEFWTPQPVHYRTDLWDAFGSGGNPASWDALLRAAAQLRTAGHPVGLGLSEDQESSWSLLGLMHAYGGSIQDENGNLALKSAGTVEAVKLATSLFRTGMNDEVFAWDALANNRLLASGKGSFIVNGIGALRAVELENPDLAAKIGLSPFPGGPAAARAPYLLGVYVIWNFARNAELARQFLVDLAVGYREAFIQSQFYKMPAFPGAVPDLDHLLATDTRAEPSGKYGMLTDSTTWSTNLGHPGHANAAVEEVFNRHLIPKMFGAAVRGHKAAEVAVADTEAEMRPIFDKWRDRGKI